MENRKKINVKLFAIILILFIIIAPAFVGIIMNNNNSHIDNEITGGNSSPKDTRQYAITDNNLSKFDLSFLKFENEKVNKIYSPLSIKYAFKMLEEATSGNAKQQISNIVEAYNLTKYNSNENMALANAFFIKNSYKNNVKENYINLLKTNYNANVEFDDFTNATNINNWVKNNTLELIPELLQDSDLEGLDYALVNALGIDMEWKHKFLEYFYEDNPNITAYVSYNHARKQNEEYEFCWYADSTLWSKKFDNNQTVSSMEVYASLNNYDPIEALGGEDKIKEIVYTDFKDWAQGTGKYTNQYNGSDDDAFNGDFSETNIKKVFDAWFNANEYQSGYIAELKENYGRVDYTTDFSIYVDDNVKVFSKDLKEYDGTTLQYIGIMPIKEDLNNYISNISHTDILNLIDNLKELKRENFKDGYLTHIHGYIPKFSFEYDLALKDDLAQMGVTDVFEPGKANLTNLTDDNSAYIATAKHKANIEFTQDGIRAAAATEAGGAGAGAWYDYFIGMPTEEIDITFDKPYMFLIRDKETAETWFVGTVYEPLDANNETNYISPTIEAENEAE